MDAAARSKDKKSLNLCKAAGWNFLPIVGDTYGAFRTDARDFVSHFISRNAATFETLTVAEHLYSGNAARPFEPHRPAVRYICEWA